MNHAWIHPQWPAPAHVRGLSTTRQHGFSEPPYQWLNLGSRTADDPDAVRLNRNYLREHAGLPDDVFWLNQVHGTAVVAAHAGGDEPEADAVWTDRPGLPCGVLTADCLPVLLCDRRGTCVAAAHAGWRGLAAGVLEATVAALPAQPEDLIAWLGPAIGPSRFEVGDDVRQAFLQAGPGASDAFAAGRRGHWYADLYRLASARLRALGVQSVHGGGFCTHTDRDRFFSYRRDGETGRMGTVIWLAR
ncbi:peptidoglycan editing factor PgeF [Aquisalimonas sp.]|uniref:peptidoglycan editing factor PgeF n=1 Tax=unclassified Aquisalimonas TaxID=2644645 RepID=UPI0025C3D91F|nr:peptidoglycan editing factor PgeF [Aquisalimonas sp.]